MSNKIIIRGARVHNLKNIDLDLPRNKLIVFTGISGSGKSSLAFDTIYAEGQRRYIESLSAYARQFLGLMDKPDVDKIEGLSPAISIDQRSATRNPRSTVGTVTEIYDYLRLLYAKIGHPHCPNCGKEISGQTKRQIVDKILDYPDNSEIIILAPVVRNKKGEHRHILEEIKEAGYARVRLDGIITDLEEALETDFNKNKKHSIEVIVDSLTINNKTKKDRVRVFDSVETALDLGDGVIIIYNKNTKKDEIFSERFACIDCNINFPEIDAGSFSFNSPHGACPECTGLGAKLEVDPDLVIPNKNLSLSEGAIRPWSRTLSKKTWHDRMIESLANEYGFSVNTPVKKLSKKALNLVLYGSKNIVMKGTSDRGKYEYTTKFEGVIPSLERRHKETNSDYIRKEVEKYMRVYECPLCNGKRLKKEILSITIEKKSIDQISSMNIDRVHEFFENLEKKDILTKKEKKIANQILVEIKNRLKFLQNVGLSYLTLDRSAPTLAGGEIQRIRLATQLGSDLVGIVYILDEPSVGLHQRDNAKLINTLKKLRDLGNTVIVVEHDLNTILNADHVVDIGPGAGNQGGEIVAQGTPNDIRKNKNSLTGKYLSKKLEVFVSRRIKKGNGKKIKIIKASEFNLKNIDVEIPLGKFVCITGVSGSGKSTIMYEILAKALAKHFYGAKSLPGKHKRIEGLKNLDKVISIDQSPIGRTPRSNPATYTGVFTYVRDLFAQTEEAKMKGYNAGHFSFNVKGGRCEACKGDGLVRIEMHFLSDVYVECDECQGKRYNREALEIHYRNKNISEVLEMTVDEALNFFRDTPALKEKLQVLHDVGLGYIKLGQPAPTLSGGEAQRIKLATELSRRATGKTLYILDEPTTGLHFADVERLLSVLSKLVDKGNTVLIIEHNLDVIKTADWIIDLGPEGGDKGGKIVTEGTPKDVMKVKESYTGQWLKKILNSKS